jgi:alpha-tubulin suppressor-like RCC1 family protein
MQIMKVFCGLDNTAFVTTEGFLFVMGSNKHGKLGIGLSYD